MVDFFLHGSAADMTKVVGIVALGKTEFEVETREGARWWVLYLFRKGVVDPARRSAEKLSRLLQTIDGCPLPASHREWRRRNRRRRNRRRRNNGKPRNN